MCVWPITASVCVRLHAYACACPTVCVSSCVFARMTAHTCARTFCWFSVEMYSLSASYPSFAACARSDTSGWAHKRSTHLSSVGSHASYCKQAVVVTTITIIIIIITIISALFYMDWTGNYWLKPDFFSEGRVMVDSVEFWPKLFFVIFVRCGRYLGSNSRLVTVCVIPRRAITSTRLPVCQSVCRRL